MASTDDNGSLTSVKEWIALCAVTVIGFLLLAFFAYPASSGRLPEQPTPAAMRVQTDARPQAMAADTDQDVKTAVGSTCASDVPMQVTLAGYEALGDLLARSR